MATITLQQLRYVKNLRSANREFVGGLEMTGEIREDASQTWDKGTLLAFDADGDVEECDTSSSLWIQIASATGCVAGQAMEDATGTTSADVYMAVIKQDDIFEGNVYHATAASAITARSQLGQRCRLIQVSGKWHVDIENTTIEDATNAYPYVVIRGFHPDDALGDIYGRVYFQFGDFTIATDGSPRAKILQLA
jgi:hypothetical protein